MKIKRKVFRCLGFIFALSLCFSSVSCKKELDNNGSELHTTNVKKYGIAEYGNYVYCEWGKIYRFNRATKELLTACMDAECDGDCPVDCVMSYFAGIDDQKLFFCGWQQFTHNVFLAYQDIVTGEVKVLKTLSEIEDSGGYITFVDNGWWYYKCKILKDGGDATNPKDYDSYICRISTDGTKDEQVIQCENAEALEMVGDQKIITSLSGKIYSVDANSKERLEIFDYNQYGYINSATHFSFLDGKLYFLARSGVTETSEYIQQKFQLSFLISIDINTGYVCKILENPIANFCLTEDGIYYSPFKLRHLFLPENPEENQDQITVCLFDESLYVCDLNGENIRKVYTNDQLDYTEKFTVIDNTLYGWMFDYNDITHTFDKTFFGAIEFDTGRIIRTKKPE